MDEWNAWRLQCKQEVAEERQSRGAKPDSVDKEKEKEEKEEIEVWVDEVIEQTEEVAVD